MPKGSSLSPTIIMSLRLRISSSWGRSPAMIRLSSPREKAQQQPSRSTKDCSTCNNFVSPVVVQGHPAQTETYFALRRTDSPRSLSYPLLFDTIESITLRKGGSMRDRYSSSCGVGFVCNVHGKRSRQIVAWGIEAVKNLTHRGAVGSDGKTGDGAGILIEIPRRYFLRKVNELGLSLSSIDNLAVGSFFLYGNVEDHIDETLKKYDFRP